MKAYKCEHCELLVDDVAKAIVVHRMYHVATKSNCIIIAPWSNAIAADDGTKHFCSDHCFKQEFRVENGVVDVSDGTVEAQ